MQSVVAGVTVVYHMLNSLTCIICPGTLKQFPIFLVFT